MALPSSPPLAPEAELPSLPAFVRLDSADALQRKRLLPDYDSQSSDPIFSDDTSSIGAEEHDQEAACPQPRRKRKRIVKGPWWTLAKSSRSSLMASDAPPPQQRRSAKKAGFRNVDSGVWMGSDASDTSDSSIRCFVPPSHHRVLEEQTAAADHAPRDPESVAAAIVNACVETCNESVVLSDIGLAHLSSDTVRPLHQLIRPTHLNLRRAPSEDEFTPLTPSLKLFLASNKLTSLPTELFALRNLSVLSLRGNQLTVLPPAIGRLKKLKELNIASNSIRFLPWELLDLLRTGGGGQQHQHWQQQQQPHIIVRPNPLVQPIVISGPSTLPRVQPSSASELENLSRYGDTRAYYDERRQRHMSDGTLDSRGELELRLKLGRMLRTQYLQEASRAGNAVFMPSKELVFLTASRVRYFHANGVLCSRRRNTVSTAVTPPGPSTGDLQDVFQAHFGPPDETPDLLPFAASRVPSLFELASRSVQQNCHLQHLDDDDSDDLLDFMPAAVGAAVRRAAEGLEHGNADCSTCGRAFVTARAEWMEYWFNGVAAQSELTQESVLPFLRKACSWACAKPTEVGEFAC